MIPVPISTRSSAVVVNTWRRHASSQIATPTSASAASGWRWSNTRAPHQVSAKEPNSTALARSIETESGTEPYRPSSMIETARIRWALPHQASARLPIVLRPGEKQQQTEHDLDIHRHQEKCVDVEVHGDQ